MAPSPRCGVKDGRKAGRESVCANRGVASPVDNGGWSPRQKRGGANCTNLLHRGFACSLEMQMLANAEPSVFQRPTRISNSRITAFGER